LINHLQHSEIDKQQWDDCIMHAANGLCYAYSWWLDIVSPGWEALVQDDFTAVMPLTWKRKMGIDYLFQPYFTQQLGVFSKLPVDAEVTGRFLDAIPARFHYIDIQLNAMNVPGNSDFSYKARKNYTLDLSGAYTVLATNYHRNCRRNIRNALYAGLTVRPGTDSSVFVSFVQQHLNTKLSGMGKDFYTVLQNITQASLENGTGEILGVYNRQNQLVAAGWFVVGAGRCIFEVCASTAGGAQHRAMYLLVDHAMQEKSGSKLIFDFAGSNIPGVAYFNAGFGASESTYVAVKRNMLPWPLRLLKP
jgi:hypothetical protein